MERFNRSTLTLQTIILLALTSFILSSAPCHLLTISDYEEYAEEFLPKGLKDYLQRGAGKDGTLNSNKLDFAKLKIFPRYLRNVSNRSTEVEVQGHSLNLPIGISPSGLHKRWHPDGELATARAAAKAGTIMIVSSASTVSIEELGSEVPEAEKWMQTFIYANISITKDVIRRAEDAGFKAAVISIDMPVSALRHTNIRNNFKDNLKYAVMEPYANDPEGKKVSDAATWDDVNSIVNSSDIPIILKGVLTAEDALLAQAVGASGIIVSNHGGRQLDGAVSSIEALGVMMEQPRFIELRHSDFEIYLDGGIRSGLDVFKAIALGANYVFVGRPPMWGLFHSGQTGVENVLEILRKEFETVMAQSGCSKVSCINQGLLSGTVSGPKFVFPK